MSIRDVWFRMLAAFARSKTQAPGLSDLQSRDLPRYVDPHGGDAAHGEEAAHAWKAHGGDRH